MDFFILIGQRHQRYQGEYLPEALEVIDEIGNSDTPNFLIEKRAEYEASKEFDALSVIRVRVPDDAIKTALHPESRAIAGVII